MFPKQSLPALGWGLLILLLSAIKGSSLPKSPFELPLDKAVHFFLYLVFCLLLLIWFRKQNRSQSLWKRCRIWAFAVAVDYGIVMEVLQAIVFNERSFEMGDVLANAAGAGIAIVVSKKLLHSKYLSG